jgi:ParB family chromosome partitioning protein
VARRSGLGKGLDALIPTGVKKTGAGDSGDSTDDGTGLRELTISDIRPNPNQPRVHFDEESLVELSASIKAIGVLQPILVRPVDNGYELIAGERRWRAAQRAGLSVIPAVVRITDELASVEQALVENLHRQDLTPLEEAAAYQQLLDDFSMTHEQVATKVGKSRSAITNSLRLLTLPPSIQQYLADGRLSAGHAKVLLGSPNRPLQEAVAKRIVDEQLSVRAAEEALRGDQPKQATKSKPTGASTTLRAPGLLELESLLSEHLQTKVSVSMGAKNGKVVVDFADLEDLERIYRLMVEGSSDYSD